MLADQYLALRRFVGAEAVLLRSVAASSRSLGIDHPAVGKALASLAGLYREMGRNAEAEAVYKRNILVWKSALGSDHVLLSSAMAGLARVYFSIGDWGRAFENWKEAASIVARRSILGTSDDEVRSGARSRHEIGLSRDVFVGATKSAFHLAATQTDIADTVAREAFQLAQRAVDHEAAAALWKMAARGAAGSPTLAAIVRERQDLVGEWQRRDGARTTAVSQSADKRDLRIEAANVARLNEIDARIATIDTQLEAEFPEYAMLRSPQPMSVEQVQADLRPNEALVLFLDTSKWEPLPEESFVWIVTKTDQSWLRSEMGTVALNREVAALRCGLDATAWQGEGAKRCAGLLQLSPDTVPAEGAPLPFDATRAHALYRGLLGEAADLIKGKHLLVVPSGALTTLPFHVLVTEPPKSKDLAAVRWLIRDHAITVLPSVASLASLRRIGKPSAAARPMIGFANPLLDGDHHDSSDKQRAARAHAITGCAAAPGQQTAALRSISRSATPVPQASGMADLAHLRMQTPLPETADEVCTVARRIDADPSEMRIGARATESEVKRLSAAGELAKYRILHFATHGLLAGQLTGTREPGLILTPPGTATAEDDGYLSGSEIASLKLDADWVILSACNTAGGAGEGASAEALSGLARVFLYGGARALLVSHWEVDSDAAVKLVTGAIGAIARDKSIGRAEALRRAMLAAMTDTTRPKSWMPAWHPSVWAPFVVVGEGGAGR